MTRLQLKEVIRLHAMWLNDEDGGLRADLSGANLSGAQNILSLGPMPSSGRIIYARNGVDGIMIKAGCFWGTLKELLEKSQCEHSARHHAAYRAAVQYIETVFKGNTK